MKLSSVKAMFGKVMAIGLVASAAAFVVPVKAQAQQFGFGVQFGSARPYYEGERRDFYAHERFERERAERAQREAWRRHEAHEQHERWEHARGDYDRDRGAYRYAAPYGYYDPQAFYGR